VPLSPAPKLLLNPDVGVSPPRTRRRFTAEHNRVVLQAVAACTAPGEIGALLRREGLYSWHLTAWLNAVDDEQLRADHWVDRETVGARGVIGRSLFRSNG